MTHIHAAKEQWGECAPQFNRLWATTQQRCGMRLGAARDWNLHSWNNCGTQSAVVYCHSQSESSAGGPLRRWKQEERARTSRTELLSETEEQLALLRVFSESVFVFLRGVEGEGWLRRTGLVFLPSMSLKTSTGEDSGGKSKIESVHSSDLDYRRLHHVNW